MRRPDAPTLLPTFTNQDDDVISTLERTSTSMDFSSTLRPTPDLTLTGLYPPFHPFTAMVTVGAPALSPTNQTITESALDVVAVVDISGSMSGSKLESVKETLRYIIGALDAQRDRLSIITFDDEARVVAPFLMCGGRSREKLIEIGGTNIRLGVSKALDMIAGRREVERERTTGVLLLSDGMDTSRNRRDQYSTTNDMVQDAFAGCIGGLKSMVFDRVTVELAIPSLEPVKIEGISMFDGDAATLKTLEEPVELVVKTTLSDEVERPDPGIVRQRLRLTALEGIKAAVSVADGGKMLETRKSLIKLISEGSTNRSYSALLHPAPLPLLPLNFDLDDWSFYLNVLEDVDRAADRFDADHRDYVTRGGRASQQTLVSTYQTQRVTYTPTMSIDFPGQFAGYGSALSGRLQSVNSVAMQGRSTMSQME
ncbi:hypothetical protein BC829DRAFT_398184 [Chytridium lagenaria]|nr:hypothetical protein BC829DRAFT_398184 [Chytridium lagenaria]